MPHEWEHFEQRGRPSEFDSTGRMTEPNRHAEVTFDELDRRYADPISREEVVALRPFFDAFCEGRVVWAYEMKTRHDRPMPTWTPITEWDAHFKPQCLALEYRTDNPFATE
jgi:hypothetical protein